MKKGLKFFLTSGDCIDIRYNINGEKGSGIGGVDFFVFNFYLPSGFATYGSEKKHVKKHTRRARTSLHHIAQGCYYSTIGNSKTIIRINSKIPRVFCTARFVYPSNLSG